MHYIVFFRFLIFIGIILSNTLPSLILHIPATSPSFVMQSTLYSTVLSIRVFMNTVSFIFIVMIILFIIDVDDRGAVWLSICMYIV